MSRTIVNIAGKRFGSWTVIGQSEKRSLTNKSIYWECQCDCGVIKSICGTVLRRGASKSCGCRKGEMISNRKIRHGQCRRNAKSSEHGCWLGMKTRCLNPNTEQYKNYGGRGIVVCQRWLESFESFFADMGPKPTPRHSLERKDVNGNYEPKNCVWATTKEQSRNRRDSHLLTFNGKTQPMIAWAEEIGIPNRTLWARIKDLGWTAEEALTIPLLN